MTVASQIAVEKWKISSILTLTLRHSCFTVPDTLQQLCNTQIHLLWPEFEQADRVNHQNVMNLMRHRDNMSPEGRVVSSMLDATSNHL